RGYTVIDNVARREIDTIRVGGRFRDNELDCRSLSYGTRPLHIKECLALFSIRNDAGIGTIDDNLGIIVWQSIVGAENSYVVQVNVRSSNDGNALASTINAFVPKREYIVNGGEIVWRHGMATEKLRKCGLRCILCLTHSLRNCGPRKKVVQ